MTLQFSRRKVGFAALGFVSLLVFAVRCRGQNSNGLWTVKNSWYYSPPSSEDFMNEIWDHPVAFREVASSKELRAEEMLKSKRIVPLRLDQARFLSGGSYRKTKKSPYLVRAVYLNRETGAFSAYQFKNVLFVDHGSLGHDAVPMKRQALIVDLSKPPENVYITCSMDE